ncbi:dihydrodipicolinate synthase family protein [Actinorhabdospora filicis]|uniref:dihydrodipicolinate synthase family protein n=1 Tax=Actinorhabdospora filicis TaxID=1785913 RepID=UPI0025532ADB|nr:dihydrodipicolinate synthase family protein [Actinorhabdospora filicis]
MRLPDGTLHTLGGKTAPAPGAGPLASRTVYSAAHVVADPLADNGPGRPAVLDWDATLAFRRHLWSHGLGVAEAMDTAQRGMGLDWAATRELIERSSAEARAHGGLIACGAGTDQLTGASTLDDVIAAYEEQLAVVDAAGAVPILMCSRALASVARGPEDYLTVYDRLLAQVTRPVILHWLGPMFDPALTGYWGSADLGTAAGTLLELIAAHASKVDGVKISLLDAGREIAFRRRLPAGVRCYTGDDFNYPELIEGDEHGYSHALLGIFDPLAAHASAAVRELDAGNATGFRAILDPTVPLARHTFAAPTFNYKTGVVFLAWLAGHQDAFRMVGGLENARDIPYLARLFVLADEAGLYPDPEAAAAKMRALLTVAGVAR